MQVVSLNVSSMSLTHTTVRVVVRDPDGNHPVAHALYQMMGLMGYRLETTKLGNARAIEFWFFTRRRRST